MPVEENVDDEEAKQRNHEAQLEANLCEVRIAKKTGGAAEKTAATSKERDVTIDRFSLSGKGGWPFW